MAKDKEGTLTKIETGLALLMPAYLAEYNVLSTEKTNQINQSNIVPSSDKKLEEILSHISFAFLGPLYQAGPGASDALDSIFNGTG